MPALGVVLRIASPNPQLFDAGSLTRYRARMWNTRPYRDTVALQQLIMAAAPKAGGKELALMSRAYGSLEMLKLRLKMKPAPKPIDTTKIAPSAKRANGVPNFSET
jgi:hypothetical protein